MEREFWRRDMQVRNRPIPIPGSAERRIHARHRLTDEHVSLSNLIDEKYGVNDGSAGIRDFFHKIVSATHPTA
jgi:hypothetical protein